MCSDKNDAVAVPAEVDETWSHMKPEVLVPEKINFAR